MRKLVSLNLALLLLFTCAAGAVPAGAVSEAEHQYENYVVIDGVEYELGVSHSEDTWVLFSYGTLILDDYQGGAIASNCDLSIEARGENVINGENGCGIQTDGNLDVFCRENYGRTGCLKVSGADGYPAIKAQGVFSCQVPLTAAGGNTSAIQASSIDFQEWRWPCIISVGDDQTNAAEGKYTQQPYVDVSRIPYTLTLDGNGGVTGDRRTSFNVTFTYGTPGCLNLNPYQSSFKKEDRTLLGWTETPNNQDTFRQLDEEYRFPDNEFNSTLYALWSDEGSQVITLKNYYDSDRENYYEKVVACKTGSVYCLPDVIAPGACFLHWKGANGATYEAGTEIQINESCSFTAVYETLKIIIDGKEYDANRAHQGVGWRYYPYSGRLQLTIYDDYSGKYIELPQYSTISLYKSLVGVDGKPAIHVNGDVFLSVSHYYTNENGPMSLAGGSGAPAVTASGDITISVPNGSTGEKDVELNIFGGNSEVPALSAGGRVLTDDKVFYAGADENNLELVGKYSGEHYLCFKGYWDYYIEVYDTATLPDMPENDVYQFFAWRTKQPPFTWYLPGETIDAGNGLTLEAIYLHENRSTIALFMDGNGGKTDAGSRYHVTLVSTYYLTRFPLPETPFTNDGMTFAGYNTVPNGTGKTYQAGGTLDDDDGSTYIYNFYAQWQDNSGGGGGGGGFGGGGGGGSTEPPAGFDDLIQAAEQGGAVVLPAEKGQNSVTLTKENVETVRQKQLNVTAETAAGWLALNYEDLAQLDAAAELKIAVEKAEDTFAVGGVPFRLSAWVGGRELNEASGRAGLYLDGVRQGDVVTVVRHQADGSVKEVFLATVEQDGLVEFPVDGLSYYSLLKRSETPAHLLYQDVGEQDWFEKAAGYVYQNGLFNGMTAYTFAPGVPMSREMFVTVLYRMYGAPAVTQTSRFSDVTDKAAYYHDAVLWAAEQKLLNGYPDGRFGVGDPITREQMATILYRYVGTCAKGDVALGDHDALAPYGDADRVSPEMYDAFRWAVHQGLIQGDSELTLSPDKGATRAEVAQLIMNYRQKA